MKSQEKALIVFFLIEFNLVFFEHEFSEVPQTDHVSTPINQRYKIKSKISAESSKLANQSNKFFQTIDFDEKLEIEKVKSQFA